MTKSKVSPVRMDKFLWSVRVYKTRSQASDACRNGRVLIQNVPVKPSRIAEINDLLIVKKMPVIYTYKIIGIPPSRVGAALVSSYIEDLTPEEEKAKLEVKVGINIGHRKRGTGRPTKRERRDIDKYKSPDN